MVVLNQQSSSVSIPKNIMSSYSKSTTKLLSNTTNSSTEVSKKPMKKKKSYGLILIHFDSDNTPRILLVKRHCTYAFSTFANGQYTSRNINSRKFMKRMINCMTHEERFIFKDLVFDRIWSYVWGSKSMTSPLYLKCKDKFNNEFSSDERVRYVQDFIKKSEDKNIQSLWEIPKGRKDNESEADADCAMREFEEETGVNPKNYTLNLYKKYEYSYIDNNVNYFIVYFVATTNNPHLLDIKYSFNKSEHHIREVADIRWFTIDQIDKWLNNPHLSSIIEDAYNLIKPTKPKNFERGTTYNK